MVSKNDEIEKGKKLWEKGRLGRREAERREINSVKNIISSIQQNGEAAVLVCSLLVGI